MLWREMHWRHIFLTVPLRVCDHLTKDDLPDILLSYSGKVICTEDHITTRSCAYKVHAKRSSNLSDVDVQSPALQGLMKSYGI